MEDQVSGMKLFNLLNLLRKSKFSICWRSIKGDGIIQNLDSSRIQSSFLSDVFHFRKKRISSVSLPHEAYSIAPLKIEPLYITQNDPEVSIFLFLPPELWDYHPTKLYMFQIRHKVLTKKDLCQRLKTSSPIKAIKNVYTVPGSFHLA